MQKLRLLNFNTLSGKKASKKSIGALLNNGKILDFSDLSSKKPELAPYLASIPSIISSSNTIIPKLKSIISSNEVNNLDLIDSTHISYNAPIQPIRNIMCIGKNYIDHVAEIHKASINIDPTAAVPADIPKYPMFFTKATTSVIGHQQLIQNHQTITQYLDYEAELAVIIGQEGTNIPVEEAMNYIFGYTIGNDITARDIQKKHGQWYKGKSLNTSCPLGPYIIPTCDLLDPTDLSIKLWLNHELKQNSRTSKMIFNISHIISQLSQGMTLLPGDIILTGTPDGVGYAAKPPRTLLPGDHVKIEIEGIGILENTVSS